MNQFAFPIAAIFALVLGVAGFYFGRRSIRRRLSEPVLKATDIGSDLSGSADKFHQSVVRSPWLPRNS